MQRHERRSRISLDAQRSLCTHKSEMACSSVAGTSAFFSPSSSSSCGCANAPHSRLVSSKSSLRSLASANIPFHAKLRISRGAALFSSPPTKQQPGLLPIQASEGSVERSYVMVKPDGVQRGLVGEIISRFERKGFIIKGLKLFSCPTELAEEHYKDLSSKPFFPKLVKYITSGPVVCLALEGPGVVASARKLIGVTNPLLAEPGTIRGDLGIEVGRNVIHGSDSPENGEREIALWFKGGEICDWEQTMTPWLRE